VRDQSWNGLEDGDVEQDEGFGCGIGGMTEIVDVAVWTEAADDGGAWRRGDRAALVAHGDFAIVADADAGSLAPDVGPPRALRRGTDHGALVGQGLLAGGPGSPAQFAVKFVLVGVGDELVESWLAPVSSTMCSAASRGTSRFYQ